VGHLVELEEVRCDAHADRVAEADLLVHPHSLHHADLRYQCDKKRIPKLVSQARRLRRAHSASDRAHCADSPGIVPSVMPRATRLAARTPRRGSAATLRASCAAAWCSTAGSTTAFTRPTS